MDNVYLSNLIQEVHARDGGLVLNVENVAKAVVLSVEKYNELLKKINEQELVAPQHVLVTGGAGYIGIHTVRELLAAGFQVTVLDNLSYGKPELLPGSAKFIEGDLQDINLLRDILVNSKIDAVMHLAASLEVQESVEQPEKYIKNNFINTYNLLQAMAETGVKKIIFSSTAAVYGEQTQIPIPESAEAQPNNPYGASKLLAEQLIKYYVDYLGFSATVFRYFNVCGTDPKNPVPDTHKTSHLIPILLEVANGKRDRIVVFGNDYNTFDGTCVRDYVHVLDIARAHLLALVQIGVLPKFNVYNVGTGKGTSVEEMINAATEVTGRMIPIEIGPRRPGDAADTRADATKIMQELGFAPQWSDTNTILQTSLNS